jgi:hypothetical protein
MAGILDLLIRRNDPMGNSAGMRTMPYDGSALPDFSQGQGAVAPASPLAAIGSQNDYGLADMERRHSELLNEAYGGKAPQMRGPIDKKQLVLVAGAAALAKLLGASNDDVAQGIQGYTQGATESAKVDYENQMNQDRQRRQLALGQAGVVGDNISYARARIKETEDDKAARERLKLQDDLISTRQAADDARALKQKEMEIQAKKDAAALKSKERTDPAKEYQKTIQDLNIPATEKAKAYALVEQWRVGELDNDPVALASFYGLVGQPTFRNLSDQAKTNLTNAKTETENLLRPLKAEDFKRDWRLSDARAKMLEIAAQYLPQEKAANIAKAWKTIENIDSLIADRGIDNVRQDAALDQRGSKIALDSIGKAINEVTDEILTLERKSKNAVPDPDLAVKLRELRAEKQELLDKSEQARDALGARADADGFRPLGGSSGASVPLVGEIGGAGRGTRPVYVAPAVAGGMAGANAGRSASRKPSSQPKAKPKPKAQPKKGMSLADKIKAAFGG